MVLKDNSALGLQVPSKLACSLSVDPSRLNLSAFFTPISV
uniref:Uncharacterized protein n=1 Tax=Anguilla anguilla TaxID=7936 RepID=A0A0E9XZP9_ANGAN